MRTSKIWCDYVNFFYTDHLKINESVVLYMENEEKLRQKMKIFEKTLKYFAKCVSALKQPQQV